MKKLGFLAIVAVVSTVAFAASLAVPWFVDNAPTECDNPPKLPLGGEMGIVTLKSTVDHQLVCSITYYNANGDELGPFYPDNTFTIAPKSALAFRPVASDPDATAEAGKNGQEGVQGLAVPNRPRSVDASTPIPGTTVIDMKKNGSITIQWDGEATDVQGQVAYFNTNRLSTLNSSYGHLLPTGKSE